jgi:D-alanine-D-alanine ligase
LGLAFVFVPSALSQYTAREEWTTVAERKTVVVIAGGDSPERAVSLSSGTQVHAALAQAGHTVRWLEISSLDDLVQGLPGADVAFNCLHGGSGEDGTIQVLFEVLDLPYVGSGPQASALAMDKLKSKAIFASKGLAVPKAHPYRGEAIESFSRSARAALGLPLVLKPCNQGSSLGVAIIEEESELVPAASSILAEFGSVFAEQFIPGRELTVSVLLQDGVERVLPVVELVPKHRFYDYAAKYTEGVTDHVTPAPLDAETTQRVKEAGLAAHRMLGCYGFSRVDLRLGQDGVPYILEVNTLPGITPTSNLPAAAAAAGIPFVRLLEFMLESALKEDLA